MGVQAKEDGICRSDRRVVSRRAARDAARQSVCLRFLCRRSFRPGDSATPGGRARATAGRSFATPVCAADAGTMVADAEVGILPPVPPPAESARAFIFRR